MAIVIEVFFHNCLEELNADERSTSLCQFAFVDAHAFLCHWFNIIVSNHTYMYQLDNAPLF